MSPSKLALFLALVSLGGCEHPPLVDTTWGNRARSVISPDTPTEEPETLMATWGPEDDREEDCLASLSGDDDLVRVEMKLGPGVHLLEDAVLLTGVEVLIQGAGPHKTVIEWASDNKASLLCQRSPKVTVRGVTFLGTTGGGIRIRGCPEVEISDVHVLGSRFGFELQTSTARVSSSLFAGCQEALLIDESKLELRETAFIECWVGVGGQGTLDAESCAFVEGRDGIKARLERGSRVVSCLFAGERQSAGWEGHPSEARANLAGLVDLGDRLGPQTNRLIRKIGEFPDDLPQGLPPAFDVAGVDLAIARGRFRGEKDPPGKLRNFGADQAVSRAKLARQALLARRFDEAKREARVALRYASCTPVEELPDEVGDVKDLALD